MVLAVRTFTPQVYRRRLCPQANTKAPELPLKGASGHGGVVQGHSSDLVARRATGQREEKPPPHVLSVAAPYHFGTWGRPSGRTLAQRFSTPALPQAIPQKNGKKIASWGGDAVFLCSYSLFINLGMPGGSMGATSDLSWPDSTSGSHSNVVKPAETLLVRLDAKATDRSLTAGI